MIYEPKHIPEDGVKQMYLQALQQMEEKLWTLSVNADLGVEIDPETRLPIADLITLQTEKLVQLEARFAEKFPEKE